MNSSSILKRNSANIGSFYISPKIEIIRIPEIEASKQTFVDIIRRLGDSGEITIQRGGIEDELI